MYRDWNPNPTGKNVGDCTVRAIAKAMEQDWASTYIGLALQGLMMSDMPSANAVWGAYLRSKGYKRHIVPDTCPDCYSVADFAQDHPDGVYILALSSHVVCVEDGEVWDSWDSSGETPLYYWEKE